MDGWTAGDSLRSERCWRWALVAVLVASFGAALHYGSLTPRGFAADETSHTLYAIEIGEGNLPDASTLVPGVEEPAEGEPALDDSDYIYVANHPPLFSAVQALVARTLQGLGLADGIERGVGRALNALCVMGAVAALAALGRELSGSRRVGVFAAATFAACPAVWSLATYGYSDGLAVLAVVLTAWTGARVWRTADGDAIGWFAASIALAGAARATSLIAAIAIAVVVVLKITWPFHLGRILKAGFLVAWPVTLLTAWWYVRNWVRFGDPVASGVLVERLNRVRPDGGVLGRMASLDMWRYMTTDLTASVYSATVGADQPRLPSWAVGAIGVAALLAAIGLLLPARWLDRATPRVPSAWPILLAGTFGVALGIALHTSNGGTPHPRYLLLGLPLLVLTAVIGLDRLHPMLATVALLAMVAASVSMITQATEWMDLIVLRTDLESMGSTASQQAGSAIAAVGTVAALVLMAVAGRLQSVPPAPTPQR